MKTDLYPALLRVRASISPDEWDQRVAEADRQAAILAAVSARVSGGQGRTAAIRDELAPGASVASWWERLQRFEAGGRDALINRRIPVVVPTKLTPIIEGFVVGLLAARPELRSVEIAAQIEAKYGIKVAGSTVRYHLRDAGLSHPVGRPTRAGAPEPLPLAGAELLTALDAKVGAVAALTTDLATALSLLPEPEGEVRADTADRDESGRFLKSYNAASPRRKGEVGAKFRSVEELRKNKNLPAMRTANSSEATLHRKAMSLVMLPVVVNGPRWESLRHWRGDQLGKLVGHAYQPATLDKFLRELKEGGLADAACESVASFWLRTEGTATDSVTGVTILYADASVKPLWTQYFTKSAKVAKLGGRVMPAVSTMFLHSGVGTPLLYRSFSGYASLANEAPKLLQTYEELAGEGTARRLIVLDREGHSVKLFKELNAGGWLYIIPLRRSVTGENARFEDLGDWTPYGTEGDAVREGRLLLQDSRKDEGPLWSRVVGRRRHRTGKVAWYATNTPLDEFGGAHLIDLYFGRWPYQEHVFRDGNGAVGLDAHHGYGKRMVQHVAVLDQIERTQGSIRRQQATFAKAEATTSAYADTLAQTAVPLGDLKVKVENLQTSLDNQGSPEPDNPTLFQERYHDLRATEATLAKKQMEAARLDQARRESIARAERATALIAVYQARIQTLSKHTEIYTIDTELDEILLAFKITFMNLCRLFLTLCCGGIKLEIDTLVQAVFTLPGERVVARTTETIRIYRQPRDREIMPIVEEACRVLTAERIIRRHRRLIFEVVDGPGG